jgi:DNA-binding IclR family transcriptional regulator
MDTAASQKLVKSAIRTMQLFTVFADKNRPLSLAELAHDMDAPKSSCFELIQTLIHLGYIIAIDGGKSYYPSRRLLDTAQKISQFNPIKEKVESALKRLRDVTGETVFIGRFQGKQVVYSDVFDGTQAVRYTPSSGDLKAIHASALGKALLATLDKQIQNQLLAELKLERFNENTITTKKALKENLQQCEQQGIYTTVGEHLTDVMGLAVPVKIQGHQLAIGMAGPIQRMQNNLKSYSLELQEVAGAITS